MFQEFYSNNIIAKFIKELLRTTNIPTVQVWKPGRPLIKGFTYITSTYIVEALQDFTVKTLLQEVDDISKLPPCTQADIEANHYCIVTTNGTPKYYLAKQNGWTLCSYSRDIQGPTSNLDSYYFNRIKPYVEGEEYFGITSNYISNSSSYDSDTHEHLGDYLRMYRDLHNIDLMPYYNCWNGSYSDKIRFSIKNGKLELNTNNTNSDDGRKVLVVPIKFNQKYTIYINSNYPIQMFAAYYDNTRLLRGQQFTPIEIQSCSNAHPYVYKGVSMLGSQIENDSKFGKIANNILLEEYLTLFIQLPESNTSSIFILEGDYSDVNLINICQETVEDDITKTTWLVNRLKQVVFGNMTQYELDDKELATYCRTPSSLSRVLNNKSYAFNNRLVEYLLLNVIDTNDEITQNLERTQKYITSYKMLKTLGTRHRSNNYTAGIWDNATRKYIFDLTTSLNKCPYCVDINGFVDKDTESIILRGKE